jgi:molybdate transport system ATP-binding protein
MMLLEVNVVKQIGSFTTALSFSIDHRRCGVIGPSGSGKSTLMSLLAGLLEADSGKIVLNKKTLFDSDKKINLPPEERRVGVVFQHAHLFPHMNVEKNIFYGFKRIPSGEKKIDPSHLIEALQLAPYLNRSVLKLSGGERQRVALARTLLASPELILLDEPLTGLDSELKYQIIPHLQKVFTEFSIPILFISHSLQEIRMMTDEVLVMHQGKLVKQLRTEEYARSNLGAGGFGYENHLSLTTPEDRDGLLKFDWGGVSLKALKGGSHSSGKFCLNGRDILLFKKHPEATSARNMLSCKVKKTYETDWLVGVELDCKGNTLIAEIVPQSVEELEIRPEAKVVAAFKASALHRLY